ncbi:MAG: FAD-dependent monooxygenase, partial [Jatrophihabitantaceae bacterium]
PGGRVRYDGFGMSAISRHALLEILREQAEAVGARLHFEHEPAADELVADVLALADGATSTHRTARQQAFGTSSHSGSARYIWLGTSAGFGDVVAFAFVHTEFGPMAAHCYPYTRDLSTVVIELDDSTWHNAGFDSAVLAGSAAGEIAPAALDLLAEVFADNLGGHRLISNRSKWGIFSVLSNQHWFDGNAVLLGDAAHTAHFTVGSGTKMALEDAIGLANSLAEQPDRASAFAGYERLRRPAVTRTQRLAEPSMRWWETYGHRLHLPPAQFGLHFLTRTEAVSYLGLRRRSRDRVEEAERSYYHQAGAEPTTLNAIGAPLQLGELSLANRLVSIEQPGSSAAGLQPIGNGLILQDDPATPGELHGPGNVRFARLRCPHWPAPAAAADELVEQAIALREKGFAAVLLTPAEPDPAAGWEEYLRQASRIRTEAGVAVAVCVAEHWALDLTRDADRDAWPTRIHLALIAGRVDLVVATGWQPNRNRPGSQLPAR